MRAIRRPVQHEAPGYIHKENTQLSTVILLPSQYYPQHHFGRPDQIYERVDGAELQYEFAIGTMCATYHDVEKTHS